MILEVRHLRLIQAIANEGSVTRAGDRLYLTQSALSHQLRDAEEKLGTPLFTRINKRMVLTPAGERLLISAHKVLDEMKRAEEDLRQIALSREGVLRISTECYTCYHWLPSLLKTFNKQHPGIDVQIVVEATQNPLQALLDGKIDLALLISPTRHPKLTYRALFEDELVVVMSPGHRLSSRNYLKAEDFADEHLILYSSPEESFAFQQVLAPAGVTPRHISSVQLTEALVEMVKGGIGLGIMTRWSVLPQIESGALRALSLTRKGLQRRWTAGILKSKSTPCYLEAFISLLADNSVLVLHEGRNGSTGSNGLRMVKAVNSSVDHEASRRAAL
jgi:LysR family transcriptional regulator for metE and metH